MVLLLILLIKIEIEMDVYITNEINFECQCYLFSLLNKCKVYCDSLIEILNIFTKRISNCIL